MIYDYNGNPVAEGINSPAFTGVPTAPTAAVGTDTTQIATTAFVKTGITEALAVSDAMEFKGTLGTGGTETSLPNPHNQGDTYKVITAGTYAGFDCEIGDMLICLHTGQVSSDSDWVHIPTNSEGTVTGPTSSTDNHVAIFNGISGNIIKDSGLTIASSVPANAVFTDTTYTAGTGISIGSGNAINHSNSIIPGTAGSSAASSGITLDVPYITYDSQGHITAAGNRVHTISEMTGATGSASGSSGIVPAPLSADAGKFLKGDGTWATVSTEDTKNTAGATDTSSKIYLIGATSQATNPQTYSHDTAYVGADGFIYSGGEKVLTSHQSLADYATLANPAFTGTPTAPTASLDTDTTQIATTAFVNAKVEDALAASDAMRFMGTIGIGGTIQVLPAEHSKGDTYKVITDGTYAGVSCHVGDTIICLLDGSAASDADWVVVPGNSDGAVLGPVSSTNNNIAVFDGIDGKAIKDSGYSIGTSVPANAIFTDTLNTAGSTDTSNKIYLIGTTSQTASSQTYSHDTAYVGADGKLYSDSKVVLTEHQSLDDYATLADPAFTGVPTAPTAASGTNTTQIATTAFVESEIAAQNTFGASGANHSKGLVPDPGETAGTSKFLREDGTWTIVATEDTKNTAGATDTSSKIYLIGALEQTANPQTYSQDTAYIGADGKLYSDNKVVLTEHQSLAAYATLANPTFTGIPEAPTAVAGTNTTQIATTAFVKAAIDASGATADAMRFKGTVGTGGTVSDLPATHKPGDTYKVKTAGTYAGQVCEVGDMIICVEEGEVAADADWTVVQVNIDGVVVGPASSVDSNFAAFDGVTGKLLKNSGYSASSFAASNHSHTISNITNLQATLEDKADAASTLAGYGITDAKIVNGTITLGSNSITPLTSHQDISGKVSGPSSATSGHIAVFDGTTGKVIKDGTYTIGKSVPSDAVFTDTTYESKTAASGGTDVSLVTTGEKYTWNNKGTYSKPSGGIPKTDLAEAVQTSLGKADTAIQSHQDISGKVNGPASSVDAHVVIFNGTSGKTIKDSGYTIGKSVPSDAVFTDTTYESKSAASGGTAVSLVTTGEKYTWNSKGSYSKPSGGIPKTDLASAVQTSLGLADTALQSHQDISGKADKASITAGTAGTSSATSGSTLAVPYVTMNAQGIVTGYGTHTHTVTGFLTSHQDISGKADKATTLAGYGITDAKIANGTITLGSNSLTPVTSQSLDGYVPTSRTINGKALTSNISLTAVDVGAIGAAQSNNFTAYQTFSANSGVTSETSISGTPAAGSIRVVGGIAATSGIKGSQVYNAVWNDLADCIPVDDEAELEYGYVYCFDGNHYYKSTRYMDDGIIGIHSDTAGFVMGTKNAGKEMQVAVAGFVLAYVDREYKPGTPLTCTCCGMLTEIHKQDKMENPEKVVATYWKPETSEEWGSENKKVVVNGRAWVKVK